MIVIGLIVIVSLTTHRSVTIISDPDNLAGIERGDAPWAAELTYLRERLNQIGLPALSQEGTALHIHQHLDIFVNGKPVAVPVGVGVNESSGFISDIHIHDNTGIIHVEAPVIQDFTLGQFFDIWGVRFTLKCIGGYCRQDDKALKLFVNGALYSGDPRQLILKNHQEIVVAYGTDQELPNLIPSAYTFPAGY